MDVPISIYTSVVKLTGANVPPISLPPSLEETQPAINPPGTSDISGLVPYNGAIDNVDLGEQGLSTGFVKYDNTPTNTPTDSGTVVWNPDKYTLDLSMGLGDSVQQIGMETYYTPVKNQTGSLIPDGTFVMATGSLGASGRMTIAPAVTDGSVDSKYMLGVTTHDIADGEDGLVTWFGEIRGFNTNTKAPVGETWVDGTVLWNNPSVAGGFTSVEPSAPNLKIPVAIVISAGNNGVIFVRPRLGMRLTDLHDVDAFTPSDKDLISYDSALGHWDAKSLGSVIGGTSSQFLKGDGSLDSNSYALASQINIATGQVAFGTGSGVIGGDSGLTWDNALKQLNIAPTGGINRSNSLINIAGSISVRDQQTVLVQNSTLSGIDFYTEDSSYLSKATNKIARIIPFSDSSFGQAFGLAFYTSGADLDSTEKFRITSGGLVGLNTTSPTNTLDVNGTARIRTINNLGSTPTEVLVPSATGVVSSRTLAEFKSDLGLGSAITGSISSGQVAFGTGANTIGGSSLLTYNSTDRRLRINGNNGATAISSTMHGIDLVVGSANTTSQYFPAIKWLSQDPNFTTNNPRLIALITANASQTYSTDNASGGGIIFWTSPINNGASNLPIARWSILENGNLVGLGNFSLGLNTTSPTNTLDVNGTARIRTLSNATGDFVTASATGVLQKRTAAEVRGDIGGIGGSIASGQVAFGTGANTIGSDSGLTYVASAGILSLNNKPNGYLLFDQRKTSFVSGITGSAIYQSGSGGTYPFDNIGNIVIQSRSSINRDIVFVVGSTPNVIGVFNVNGFGIATTSPTNTLDVNGTARIRTLSGTTGYLPLLSSTGVMGQSVAYNSDTGIVINGTTLPSGAVFSVNGLSYFTNYATAGAYDKLAIDFGENRGFGYDGSSNEIFVKGTTTVPVKIDTDAPTDSFNILSTGGIKMANIPSGTPVTALGLDSNNDLVKSTAVSQFADNESITSAGFTNVITPTSDTEYSFTFSSFDRSAAVGTTYEFEFGAIIVWQNATNINDFKAIIDITSNLTTLLPLIPTATSFPNHYIFKISVTRTNDGWIQVYDARGGSSQLDSRIRYTINSTTTYTGSVTPKLGLKTPTSAFTTGDYIRFLYMNKRRIK